MRLVFGRTSFARTALCACSNHISGVQTLQTQFLLLFFGKGHRTLSELSKSCTTTHKARTSRRKAIARSSARADGVVGPPTATRMQNSSQLTSDSRLPPFIGARPAILGPRAATAQDVSHCDLGTLDNFTRAFNFHTYIYYLVCLN